MRSHGQLLLFTLMDLWRSERGEAQGLGHTSSSATGDYLLLGVCCVLCACCMLHVACSTLYIVPQADFAWPKVGESGQGQAGWPLL